MLTKSASKPKNNTIKTFKVGPCRFGLRKRVSNVPSRLDLVGLSNTPEVEEVHTSGVDLVGLTISIVSFNTQDLLRRCLASIYQYTKNLNFEVIVVDNASKDGSVKMVKKYFPRVKLIVNKTNRYYTKANNQVLRLAQGKYFLILNSDTYLTSNALKKLVDYLNHHPKVGAVEPLQRYEDGRIAATGSKHNTVWLDLIELTILHRLIKPKSLSRFRMESFNRKLTYPAEVISDGAMMTKTDLIKNLHGYDENLKLYYTENDLCRRIQAQKFTTVHLGSAQVWHTVSASTAKAGWKTISQIYSRDTLAYYLKYGGKISAFVLFLAMGFNNLLILLKQNLALILIILLATWLRFFRLPELMTFISDQGKDYLAARDMVQTGQPALVGIASSVPWLYQGPFFVWMIAFVFKLSGFNPVHPAVLTATLGVLTVYLTYKFSRSLLAGFILAASPLAVVHSRLAYHISPIPLFSILYLMALQNQSVVWSFLLAGILLQFELTTLPLVIFAVLYLLKRKQKLFPAALVFLLPFIPKIIFDLTHGFKQTFGLIAWAGYRLVSFFGFSSRHTVSLLTIQNVSQTVFEYWQKFVCWDQPIIAAALGLLALISIFKHRLLFYFLLINLSVFFLHGAPSEAYFPVLFPLWALMIALIKPKIIKALIILVCFYNIYFLVSRNFLTYGPALKERIALVQLIKSQTNYQPFQLLNPGFDNYRYLLWWFDSPASVKADKQYQIYDDFSSKFVPPLNSTVYHFPNSKLIKL